MKEQTKKKGDMFTIFLKHFHNKRKKKKTKKKKKVLNF